MWGGRARERETMHSCVWVHGYMCLCTCPWRSEKDIRCSVCSSDAGYLQELGWHFLGYSGSQQSPVMLLSLPCLDLGLQACATCPACDLGVGM